MFPDSATGLPALHDKKSGDPAWNSYHARFRRVSMLFSSLPVTIQVKI
jgi:hypothetical protein